jgi:hypothetical protein
MVVLLLLLIFSLMRLRVVVYPPNEVMCHQTSDHHHPSLQRETAYKYPPNRLRLLLVLLVLLVLMPTH